MVMISEATVRVPATSANLGPGFDCLGVALQLYNHLTVSIDLPDVAHPMADQAATAFFLRSGVQPFRFGWQMKGDVPRSRGLGSSVTLRLGLLHGLNALSDSPLDHEALYRICAELEGHPDNAAPAAFGGFAAARADHAYFRCEISPELFFVALVPPEEVETDASRVELPGEVSRLDAARNTSHACLITAAFATQRYELLRDSMQDWLHQPWRQVRQKHLQPAIAAGKSAGALDGYLSGSGSTVICLTIESPERVAAAMQKILPKAKTLILSADNIGPVITATS
jgi:homoserine kinase